MNDNRLDTLAILNLATTRGHEIRWDIKNHLRFYKEGRSWVVHPDLFPFSVLESMLNFEDHLKEQG